MTGDSSPASSASAPAGTLAAPPPQPTSSTLPGRPARTAARGALDPRPPANTPRGTPDGDAAAAAEGGGGEAVGRLGRRREDLRGDRPRRELVRPALHRTHAEDTARDGAGREPGGLA